MTLFYYFLYYIMLQKTRYRKIASNLDSYKVFIVLAEILTPLFLYRVQNYVQADFGGVLDAVARAGGGRILFQCAGQVNGREKNRVASVDGQRFHLNRLFDDGRFI